MVESVTVSIGATINLGDFNSMRVDLGRTVPVPSGKTAAETEEALYKALEKSLVKRVKKLKEELD